MLPSAHRLRRSADFTRVIRDGRRTSSPTLVLHALPVAGHAPTRVGFVVSKAVGSAVVRNRVKRRLRHSADPLVAVPGWELVLRANPIAADADAATLRRDLGRVWEKARS